MNRCSRRTTICSARRTRSCSRSGCGRSGRWRAASRTTSTMPSRRSRCTSTRCSRTKPASASARASSSRSSSARSTTSRTPWRAWASSTGSGETQLELAQVEVKQRAARGARAHARALERHGAAARRGHRDEDRNDGVRTRSSWRIESEMREALVNLVLNATDAMPEGGTLTLRTGHASKPARASRAGVFIEVVDTGIGMDEATRRRCLEPFFTTKGERGSGLGLAMVYGIAQRHGVDIDIQSAPGEGTTFRLTFPQSAPGAAADREPPHPEDSESHADPADRRRPGVAHVAARGAGARRTRGARPPTAARRESRHSCDALNAGKPFPVVITDLGMPHVDGRAVAAAIKAAAPADRRSSC